jgi:hypothetical protein
MVSEAEAVAVVQAVLGGTVIAVEYCESLSDQRRLVIEQRLADLEAGGDR